MVRDRRLYAELVHGPYQVLGLVLGSPVLAPSADVGMEINNVQITPAGPVPEDFGYRPRFRSSHLLTASEQSVQVAGGNLALCVSAYLGT